MDIKTLTEWMEQDLNCEMKLIGRDAEMCGRRVHVAAMVQDKEETVLYVLAKASQQREVKQPNRQIIKDYMENGLVNMAMLQVNDKMFFNDDVVLERLSEGGVKELLMMEKLIKAGWRLPQDHELQGMDWSQIDWIKCCFHPAGGKLPDWDQADVSVAWATHLKQHFIEMPFKIQMEDGKTASACEKELAFSIEDADGTKKEAVCYINRIRVEDFWAQKDEDMQMKREMLEEVCPRGMVYLVVECECTSDLYVQFYESKYLRQVQDESAETEKELLGMLTGEPKQGPHGMVQQEILIPQPVRADEKEVWVELFTAGEVVPECRENVEWL